MADPAPPDAGDDDARLVARTLSGDPAAFESLVVRHQDRVHGHLRRLVGATAAEDLAQETFLRAWRALDRYDPAYRFVSWLLVIATRLAFNQRRDRSGEALPGLDECSHRVASTADPADANPADLSAERDEHAWRVARLERVLASLSPAARALYELRFRQDASVAELAAHFGVAEGAIKVRVHRLRDTLMQALRPPTGTAAPAANSADPDPDPIPGPPR